jgi:hypothetical protein
MPLILTAYCSGTWFDAASGDLIADLFQRTVKDATHWKALFAGPGSGQILSSVYNPLLDLDRSGERALTTYALALVRPSSTSTSSGGGTSLVSRGMAMGAQAFDESTAKALGVPSLAVSVVRSIATPLLNLGFQVTKGLAFGDGMARNVAFLLEWVARARLVSHDIVLNLVGWSRGAVTCHLMANAVWNAYGHGSPRINLFGIDPVPGDINVDVTNPRDYYEPGYSQIPPCVAQYRSIIMTNAKRFFMPVIPRPIGGVDLRSGLVTMDYDVLYMPGNHGTAVVPKTPGNISEPGPVLLTNWLIENFLLEHGTQLSALIRRTRISAILAVNVAKDMGDDSVERDIWYMGLKISLSRARFLSRRMHASGREWFERLMEQLVADMARIPVF